MNLNLKTLAAGLDDTFEWWSNQDGITVCRWYGQKLLRQATYWEPAEYTEETSETLTVKAEGSIVIILNDAGKELDREDFGDYYESDWAGMLAEMIDAQIPYRDLQAEADEAYSEWLIARAEDREAA
ncbi:hypothetical protein [Cardiobacterium hominis]|uniref:hypothetical protein n=1 Tax=Cardiobacterium hominis TaxID=2718 RepID=UPI0028D3D1E3|nr:hypothetical protein [Cardiobacterium hominis]